MIIEINRAGEMVLNNADDFKAFKVVADGEALDGEGIIRALDGIGTLEEGRKHVWFDPKAFVSAFGVDRGAQWVAQFDAMVAGAAKYGFVDDKTGAVRAHVERV